MSEHLLGCPCKTCCRQRALDAATCTCGACLDLEPARCLVRRHPVEVLVDGLERWARESYLQLPPRDRAILRSRFQDQPDVLARIEAFDRKELAS